MSRAILAASLPLIAARDILDAAPVPEDSMLLGPGTMPGDKYSVWFDEAADLEPWQFEALNDTLFGRSLTEPPSFDDFPYKRRDMLDDGGLLPRYYAPTPKQRPPKKQKPRRSKSQRQARQTMRRNRK